MGTDKGLLKQGSKSWARTAFDKMASLNIVVKVSVSKTQFTSYLDSFSSTDLITDNASLSVQGPLLGIFSCHLRYPAEDLFVMACDMPRMQTVILANLRSRYLSNPSCDAYLFIKDNQPEPLCAIYRAKGIASILDMLLEGKLSKHSMKFMVHHLQADVIQATEEVKESFRNFNTPDELYRL